MNLFKKRLGLIILLLAITVPAYAVLGTFVNEEITSSGKVCYYEIGNGVKKSTTIGISEKCPQTKDF